MSIAMLQVGKTKIKQDFSKAAEQYDRYADIQFDIAKQLYQMAQKQFSPDGRTLDIGCGTGSFQKFAKQDNTELPIYQLDIALGMCQVANVCASISRQSNIFTVNGDCEALPFDDRTFHNLYSSLMLQWLPSPMHAFDEFHRVLTPGGTLVFSTFGPETLKELKDTYKQLGKNPPILDFLDVNTLLEMLKLSRFHVKQYTVEPIVRHYPSLYNLLSSMKNIGAKYKHEQKPEPLTKSSLQALEAAYRLKYGTAEGLPATWEAVYVVCST